MERLVFLHGVYGHHKQVRSAYDVALETHVEWVLSLEVSVDAIESDSDLLVIVSDVERSDRVVLGPLNQRGCAPWKHQVHLLELLPSLDARYTSPDIILQATSLFATHLSMVSSGWRSLSASIRIFASGITPSLM